MRDLRAGSHGVSSPLLTTPNFLSLGTTLKRGSISSKSDLDYLMQNDSWDLCWELGIASCLDQTLNTNSIELHLQKVLPCMHPCHTWDLGLGNACEMVSPNFHGFQRLRLHKFTSSDSGLGLGSACEVVTPNFHGSQRLRLHKLTSSDWGLRTQERMWSGKSQLPWFSTAEIAQIDLKWLRT